MCALISVQFSLSVWSNSKVAFFTVVEKNRSINQDLCARAWDEVFGEILDKVVL
jgi:hypothetical protein